MTALADLEAAVRSVHEWIDDLKQRLDWHDRQRVLTVLLAALHGLRDSLARNEAIHLGAQLPPLLRGLYYEGWHPDARSAGRSRITFLERIHDSVHRNPGVDTEAVAHAVFALLAKRLPEAELEDAKAATPRSLHHFWPS